MGLSKYQIGYRDRAHSGVFPVAPGRFDALFRRFGGSLWATPGPISRQCRRGALPCSAIASGLERAARRLAHLRLFGTERRFHVITVAFGILFGRGAVSDTGLRARQRAATNLLRSFVNPVSADRLFSVSALESGDRSDCRHRAV